MAVKAGYKQTEVGAIPEDWDVIPIGKAGQVLGGRQRSPHYSGPSSKYLRVANVFDGFLETEDVLEMPFSAAEKEHFLLKSGDILLNEGQSIDLVGRSAIYRGIPSDCCFQNTLIRFRANRGTCTEFAQLVFQRYLRLGVFASIASQTTSIAHLGAGRLAALKMPLPEPNEQEAIAGALMDADAHIESLNKLITKKRHLKHGAMQELFRPKEGWVEEALGSLASIHRGASPRPIDNPIWFDDNSAVGWIRISDVTRADMFLRETTQRLSLLGIQSSRPVSRGSLIMSICATVGRPIIIEIDACIHDGFVVFDNLRVDKHFLYYALKSLEGGWAKHGQKGSQMNLNTGLINGTVISLPSTESEQADIAEVFLSMDAEIAAIESQVAKARQIKQGMMQNLLTGRIRLV